MEGSQKCAQSSALYSCLLSLSLRSHLPLPLCSPHSRTFCTPGAPPSLAGLLSRSAAGTREAFAHKRRCILGEGAPLGTRPTLIGRAFSHPLVFCANCSYSLHRKPHGFLPHLTLPRPGAGLSLCGTSPVQASVRGAEPGRWPVTLPGPNGATVLGKHLGNIEGRAQRLAIRICLIFRSWNITNINYAWLVWFLLSRGILCEFIVLSRQMTFRHLPPVN
jgi:hypothetical protein